MSRRQDGYALLVLVLALMSMAGIVVAGYSKQVRTEVEHNKFLHNQRVLNEARQALLYYAHNYAQISDGAQGPGRLPCADTDNDGDSETTIGVCIQLGRLPWAEPALGLTDLRDAAGERLWYAVSDNFAAVVAGGNTINSDTDGNITFRDRSGNISVDGSLAEAVDGRARGIAAIIIAPGAAIARNNGVFQDRNPANGDDPFDYIPGVGNDADEDTDPAIVNADRYLDDFLGLEDNAVFVQGGTNGFIGGPIDDRDAETIRVNDQMVVITAAEVIEYAEKAVLENYRQTLLNYDQRLDTFAAGDHYPWLYDYSVYNYGEAPTAADSELDEYPSDPVFANEPLGRSGRIPSIFTPYFSESDSRPIESRLRYEFTLRFSPNVAFTQPLDTCPQDYTGPDCTTGILTFSDGNWLFADTTQPLDNLRFQDIDGTATPVGNLTARVTADETRNFGTSLWFWDDRDAPDGIFERCLGITDDETDCDRDGGGVNVPQNPGGNQTASQVLHITLAAQYDVLTDDNISFDLDYTTPPAVTIANVASAASHSRIRGFFLGGNVDATPITITATYDYDWNYNNSFDIQASGVLTSADLVANGDLALTMRYYPELPDWAIDDGWHDGIMMAYAANQVPGIAGGPCTPATDCLTVVNHLGIDDDKTAVLVMARQHNWDDPGLNNLADNLGSVFELENVTPTDDLFDARPLPGNDRVLAMDLWP